tara:strand:+ start:896 stop:1774 length:879 start_codon:yes stop_codon:yes gene_type:complete
MSEQIITYSFKDIENISQNFTAELDPDIIEKLVIIKRNSVFFKHTTPISIKYSVSNSSWRLDNSVVEDVEYNLQLFENKITSNLNKLTTRNYKIIKTEILKIIDNIKGLDIDMTVFIDIIFDKGAEEHIYSNIYSKLLAEVIEKSSNLEELEDYVLNKSEQFYNNNLSFNISELNADDSLNDICDINKSKKLILGSIIFISNLFNYNLLSYNWVKKYYLGLVGMTSNIDMNLTGMYIDTLCAIISTCGKNLERASRDDFHQNFLGILKEFSNDKKRFKSKYRFKIKDTLQEF